MNNDFDYVLIFMLLAFIASCIVIFIYPDQQKVPKNWDKVKIECMNKEYNALKYKYAWTFKDSETEKNIFVPLNCMVIEK